MLVECILEENLICMPEENLICMPECSLRITNMWINAYNNLLKYK